MVKCEVPESGRFLSHNILLWFKHNHSTFMVIQGSLPPNWVLHQRLLEVYCGNLRGIINEFHLQLFQYIGLGMGGLRHDPLNLIKKNIPPNQTPCPNPPGRLMEENILFWYYSSMDLEVRYEHSAASSHFCVCMEYKSSITSICDPRLYAFDRSSLVNTALCGSLLLAVLAVLHRLCTFFAGTCGPMLAPCFYKL